jgi:hypothetical protein
MANLWNVYERDRASKYMLQVAVVDCVKMRFGSVLNWAEIAEC